MPDNERPKVIVIGLDGATWDLIKPWADEGKLPTFKYLMENGAWGDLESTIPPMSPPAWATIITGVKPDKHGIYDFYYFSSGNLKVVNSKDIKSAKIWEILNDYGYKQIIMNVPIAFPPDKINGFFISGMLTPSLESEFTWPPELKHELIKKGYEIETDPEEWVTKVRWKLLKGDSAGIKNVVYKYSKEAEDKINILISFIKKVNPDFVFVVLTGSDRLQHYLIDKRELLLEYYVKTDKLLKRVLDLDYFDDIVILSDHGFAKINKIFYVNSYLLEKGLITPKGRSALVKQRILLLIIKIIKKLSKLGLPFDMFLSRLKVRESGLAFDPENSKCYMYSHTSSGIFINTDDDREKETIKNELIQELNRLIDTDNNQKVLEAIPKEEVYSGPFSDRIPDIILKFEKGYTASEFLIPPHMISDNNFLLSPEKGPSFKSGDHTSDGILLLYGKHFRHTHLQAKVEDIFPTIIYLFGTSILDHVDGKILLDAFKEDFVKVNPPRPSLKLDRKTIKAIKKIRDKLKFKEG